MTEQPKDYAETPKNLTWLGALICTLSAIGVIYLLICVGVRVWN